MISQIQNSSLPSEVKSIILNLAPYAKDNPAIKQRIMDLLDLVIDVTSVQEAYADQTLKILEKAASITESPEPNQPEVATSVSDNANAFAIPIPSTQPTTETPVNTDQAELKQLEDQLKTMQASNSLPTSLVETPVQPPVQANVTA